ncbi:hypothetical protein N7481_006044 [Penicillium waksmanii]|uniref:uncharacterized protein n=1 Tax=Penicillium waksmanii TaxID=69791 RepID=UPI002549660D|nr:uncharacterized protein N7481_006044 [Penicillium waksmanii]KAJ5983945.1 hypothetical protein N7481_006044 [Penicillium waksmanii]
MPALLEDPSTRIPPPQAHTSAASTIPPTPNNSPESRKCRRYFVSNYQGTGHAEIERGATYPMEQAMALDQFRDYWFGTFAVVAVLDEEGAAFGDGLREGRKWEELCLGTFYIKPNYPGRCSHICNAGFMTTNAARGKGVGQVMGETYLEFAPQLGYTYSVFNLVFANNPASIRIWEKLGFNVIGRVPKAARLANSEELVDALIFGRELGN